MPTLYVENVPGELYDSLRARAKTNRRSIAAETLAMLEEAFPTKAELQRRAAFYQRAKRISARRVTAAGPSAEELLREDRER
jgi:hypothetical protein